MTSISSLPQIIDPTDDDASIHPYSNVGPARPLHRNTYDKRILSILQADHSRDRIKNLELINRAFDRYIEYDASSTSILETDSFEDGSNENRVLTRSVSQKTNKLLPINLVGLMVGIAVVILYYLNGLFQSYEQMRKINAIEEKFSRLEALSRELDELEKSHRGLVQAPSNFKHSDIMVETGRLHGNASNNPMDDYPNDLLPQNDRMQKNKTLPSLRMEGDALNDFVLHTISQYITKFVPVFMKDHKIRYTTEFYDFIRNITKEELANYQRLEAHEREFNKKGQTGATVFGERDIRDFIRQELEQQSLDPLKKADVCHDQFKLSNSSTELLNDVSKQSRDSHKQPNFASYEQGARVLGFLTTQQEERQGFPLLRAIFFGWYDYLTSQGLNAPDRLRFNANNALSRVAPYWQCKSNLCSIGIRLTTNVALREIVFSVPYFGRPANLVTPRTASIFIKPRHQAHANLLRSLLGNDLASTARSSKITPFLKKFVKVMEAKLSPGVELNTIVLPSNLTNLNIPLRDLYIELESGEEPTGVFEIIANGHELPEESSKSIPWSFLRLAEEQSFPATELGDDLST